VTTSLIRAALATGIAVLVLLAAEPARADHDQDLHMADVKPPPPPPPDVMGRIFPEFDSTRRTWPAFFRDSDVKLHFRSFYFNRQKSDDTYSEAWAIGGWLDYTSGWLLDTFAIGARYYMSFPAYAPDDRPGSLLLTPGQDTIGTLGEVWGALRYGDYALLRGGRIRIDEGFVNPQDNRQVPNTFEAITLSGAFDWFRYDVGYIWTIKARDSNDFISMSRQAGVTGDDEGLILTAFAFTPMKGLLLYAANYAGLDTYNTVFTKGEYTHPFSKDLSMQFGLQFTDQRSIGSEGLGDFNTWNVGAGVRLLWRGLTLGFATHFTGDESNIRTNFGSWPGYLSLSVTDFNRAEEKAFGVGVKYDFGGTLLPFQIPGLSIHLLYAQGTERINPATGGALPTTREGDLDVIYNVPAVKGLSLRFRNAYGHDGGPRVFKDFRLIVNYEIDLL
jgi:hypothetical protein